MEKHAYLIMAHKNEQQLLNLVQLLDDKRNDIYLHLDKSLKNQEVIIAKIRKSVHDSRLFFLESQRLGWGDFSLAKMQICLINKAVKSGNYLYYHLLSGLDMPLKSQNEIHHFFKEHEGQEFVNFESKKIKQEHLERLQYFYLFKNKQNKWVRKFNKISIRFQKKIKINRLKKNNITYAKGAQWFSITQGFAMYMSENFFKIEKSLKFSFCSDEIVTQTFLMNSVYRERLFDATYTDNKESIVREIDWNRGKPYVYRVEDYLELKNSKNLFARKFDEKVDSEIIKKMTKRLRE